MACPCGVCLRRQGESTNGVLAVLPPGSLNTWHHDPVVQVRYRAALPANSLIVQWGRAGTVGVEPVCVCITLSFNATSAFPFTYSLYLHALLVLLLLLASPVVTDCVRAEWHGELDNNGRFPHSHSRCGLAVCTSCCSIALCPQIVNTRMDPAFLDATYEQSDPVSVSPSCGIFSVRRLVRLVSSGFLCGFVCSPRKATCI